MTFYSLTTEPPPGAHPACLSLFVAYWRGGRMNMEEVETRRCVCHPDNPDHVDETEVVARLVSGPDLGAPDVSAGWWVLARAPEPEEARRAASTVAKALAFNDNPLFSD